MSREVTSRVHTFNRMWCASDRERKKKFTLKPGEKTIGTEFGEGCCASSRPIVEKNDYEKEEPHKFNKDVNERRKKLLEAATRNQGNPGDFEEAFSFRNSPSRIKLKKSAIKKTKEMSGSSDWAFSQ